MKELVPATTPTPARGGSGRRVMPGTCLLDEAAVYQSPLGKKCRVVRFIGRQEAAELVYCGKPYAGPAPGFTLSRANFGLLKRLDA